MKLTTKTLLLLFSFILTHTTLTPLLAAGEPEKDAILEITDRYKEVKFGITETSIYMVIDERIRTLVNNELQHQYEKDLEIFNDSEGNFIPGVHSYLHSNIVEISLSDIKGVDFDNGSLRFSYASSVSIFIEDVVSLSGTKAIDNFFIEDLELFYLTLSELT